METTRLLESTTSDGITRFIEMRPAYDKRNPDPTKNYGIHGVELVFGVRRGDITVTWVLITDWMLPSTRESIHSRDHWPDGLGSIDYHDTKPHFENQFPLENCIYTGGNCYCDGSGLASNDLFDRAVEDPSQIWKILEKRLSLWEIRE